MYWGMQGISKGIIKQKRLIFIAEILFTFNDFMYTVNEADGLVDNLIFVEKQDGRASEQFLAVNVSLQLISALGMHEPCY